MADYDNDSDARWWSKEGDSLALTVWEIGTQLEQDDEPRREQCRELLCEYLGRNDVDLDGLGSLVDEDTDRYDIDLGMIQTLCDTVHAEIAGRQKPVPKFQTSGADWKTKRMAKKLEKFCEAQLHRQQGMFLNVWELMEAAFHDSTIWGTGVAAELRQGESESDGLRVEAYLGTPALSRQGIRRGRQNSHRALLGIRIAYGPKGVSVRGPAKSVPCLHDGAGQGH